MRLMMAAVLLLATFSSMPMSDASAKAVHGATGKKPSACMARAYQIEDLFKCDADEFSAPNFSVSRSLCYGEDVGIAILGFNNGSGGGEHLLAKKIAKSCSKPAYRKWADSRKCPQLMAVANSKKRFALPRSKLPGDSDAGALMDGDYFTLQVEGFYPKDRTSVGVTLTGQNNDPVGRWVESALKVLGRCWTDTRPPR
jgi:hypothetical protein